MKKITITCQFCGKEKVVRADKELVAEFAAAKLILCQRTECQEAYPIEVEEGYIRVQYLFGEFWSLTRKATTDEQQSIWRAKKILSRGKKNLSLDTQNELSNNDMI